MSALTQHQTCPRKRIAKCAHGAIIGSVFFKYAKFKGPLK